MQNSLIKSSSKFTSLSLLVLVIPTVAIEVKQLYFIVLSENSILYIYSTIAQVIAGLIALTLISIPYLYNELEIKLRADDTLETAITTAKQNLFEYLLMIFATGIISILFCLITIGSFNYIKFQNISITLSTFSFFNFIAILFYLVFYSFDPERLTKISNNYIEKLNNDNNINKELNSENITAVITDGSKIDFNITTTSEFDSEIEKFLNEFTVIKSKIYKLNESINSELSSKSNAQISNTSLISTINKLFVFGKLSLNEINDINTVRRFYNLLLHKDSSQNVKIGLIKEHNSILNRINKILDNKI